MIFSVTAFFIVVVGGSVVGGGGVGGVGACVLFGTMIGDVVVDIQGVESEVMLPKIQHLLLGIQAMDKNSVLG